VAATAQFGGDPDFILGQAKQEQSTRFACH
jgi:hypothetical protein